MNFKSLNKVRKQAFSKTICIVAGGPHMDLVGSKIISTIKAASPDTNFIGVGGQQMQNAGLNKSYADVNKFFNKPLYPYKNFKHKHIERPVHPVFGFYHAANRRVRDQLQNSEFFDDIVNTKPDAFLCLSNDFFMNRLYNYLNDLYDTQALVKPPVFHYDKTHVNQRQEFTEWLDHQFSARPQERIHTYFSKYTFPSTVVGQEGVGRAWQYLYQQSEQFSSLTTDNHIYLSPENNKNIIEQLVSEERSRFRQSAGLSEGQHVIFFSPGNTHNDVKFSTKALKGGLNDFLNRPENQNLDKSHFVLVVNVPEEDIAQNIEQSVKGLNLPITTIFSTQKYSAMAGSDCGIVYNGETVQECAAMQLPVVIIEDMNYAQHHFMALYNHWNNDLNISTRGETQQELIGTAATPYRISEELQNMTDPKLRYYLSQKLHSTLYDMVPIASGSDKAITQGDQTFVQHGFTYNTMAGKILSAAEVYNTSDKNIPHYKINETRGNILAKCQLA